MTEAATERLATTSKEGRVGTITLTRKGNNSVASDLGDALVAALEELEADADVRVIVIRSGYEKYFSVGADLGGLGGLDRSDKDGFKKAIGDEVGHIQECFTRLEKSPRVTIAAINGHALGGGCELALACDLRIMVDDGRSFIGQTETNIGLIPGAGGTQRLPRIVGLGRGLQMILEGSRILAPEALAIGLVTEAVPPDRFDAAVRERAEKLGDGPPVALALAKRAVREGLGKETIEDALKVEFDAFVEAAATDDAVIGIMSFFAKQKPEYTGK